MSLSGGLGDLWTSDTGGSTWQAITLVSSWSARYGFSLVQLRGGGAPGRLYIVGGNDGRSQSDVWSSDDDGRTWQEMTFTFVREGTFTARVKRATWIPRYGAAAVTDRDSKLTFTGGLTDSGVTREVWTLPAPDTAKGTDPLTWKEEDKPKWSSRWGHQSFVDENNKVYILGGGDGQGCFADLWKMQLSIDISNLLIAMGVTSLSSASTKQGNGSAAAVTPVRTSDNAAYVVNGSVKPGAGNANVSAGRVNVSASSAVSGGSAAVVSAAVAAGQEPSAAPTKSRRLSG